MKFSKSFSTFYFIFFVFISAFYLQQQEIMHKWKRAEVTACTCEAKNYRHVHCPCRICNGRATSRSTEMRHWREANLTASPSGFSTENSFQNETVSDHEYMEVDSQDFETSNYEEPDHDTENYGSNAMNDISDSDTVMEDMHNGDINMDKDTPIHVNPVTKLIINAVLNALKIQKNAGLSINTFTDILEYGRKLLLESLDRESYDPDVLISLWPKTWSDVQALLKEAGYSDAKEYFICFCHYEVEGQHTNTKIKYTGKYSIMESKNELCHNCGKPGSVTYYYLGLEHKVKNWFRDKNLRQKMLSHWVERNHWLGNEVSWPVKKEIWDGERWHELQWFWNPHDTWVIPCCCKQCGIPISADHLINSEDGPLEDEKIVECPECFETFEYTLKRSTGSPFNIALIGHWDGWQSFQGSSPRNCGSLEVTIANLKKEDRNHTDEVYVLGFVPLTFVPKLTETYDPFLEPLMKDICKGFIHGFKIEGTLNEFYPEKDFQNVRVLLLCWSGDHPGQCEIGKLLNQGRCPCRRCQLIGQHITENGSNNHMYYGDNRSHYRHQWGLRKISEMLTDLNDIEAETRKSVRKQMSSMKGITGISLLHKYLYPLYGFDILQDLTFDVFHTVCLNVVKSQAERLLDHNLIDKAHFNNELKNYPWPTELKSGRLPLPIKKYNGSLGQWKAEGLQKFSFPFADCIFDKMIDNSEEREIQHLISRLTEMHFNTGRNGWTDTMIDEHYKLSWRLNILVEEVQGLKMCTISMHNLLHIHEDVRRFSATDNYWCAVFERAVKSYIKRASNCKGIEKTFAFAESRREFLKPYADSKENLGKIDTKLGIASSLETAKSATERNDTTRTSLLLGAQNNIVFLGEGERILLANSLSISVRNVHEVAYTSKRCFMSGNNFQGTVFKSGDIAVIAINQQEEQVVKLDVFLSMKIKSDEPYQLIVKVYPFNRHSELQRHFWTGFTYVNDAPEREPAFYSVNALKRKVILYQCEEGSNTVVDYQRHQTKLPFDVIVPVFPEKGDMLLIQGAASNDIWYGHASSVDYRNQTVDVFFFVEHATKKNIYIRETSGRFAKNVVPWASLIGITKGTWKIPSQWEKEV